MIEILSLNEVCMFTGVQGLDWGMFWPKSELESHFLTIWDQP